MAVSLVTVTWTVPPFGLEVETVALSLTVVAPGDDPRAVILTDGARSLAEWQSTYAVPAGSRQSVEVPHVGQPATVNGTPVTWSYALVATAPGREAVTRTFAAGVGVRELDLDQAVSEQALRLADQAMRLAEPPEPSPIPTLID